MGSTALIIFLQDHLSEAGDGKNFKTAMWNAAAVHMIAHCVKGGAKTAVACKNKYARVCALDILLLFVLTLLLQLKEIFLVVGALMEQSGFKWDKSKGADIQLDSESVWTAYVEV